nr:hypothetical protein [Tanacetum cinerariifolium]
MPSKPDLSGLEDFMNEPIVSEPIVKKPVVETSKAKASVDKPNDVRKNFGSPLIEDWISNYEDEAESKSKIEKETITPSFARIKFVKSKEQVKSPRKTTVKEEIFNWKMLKVLIVYLMLPSLNTLHYGVSGNINKTQSKAICNESSSQGTDSGGGPRCQKAMGDTTAQTGSENVSKFSNDLLLAELNTPRTDEDSLKLKRLMELCTNLQSSVLALEQTNVTQATEIDSLKRRVKKLEKKQQSRTHKLKILYKVSLTARVESSNDDEDLGEDASKQGRISDIDTDEGYQFAERLQAEEEQKLNVKEKATLFMQLIEKRRKFFLSKRAKEKRNKPPTQSHQRIIMCTYLKNMEGKKLTNLKNKSFYSIQKMFDKAFKRVNTFVDYRTKLVKESSKKAKAELIEDFNIEDVKTLWKLVKVKHGTTRPEGTMKECYSFLFYLLLVGYIGYGARVLSQKGSGVGRGVKEKSLNRNTMNTSLGIGVSMELDDTMNEDTPVGVASAVKEGVTPSVVDIMVEKEKISSLEDNTVPKSFPPLTTLVTTTAGKKVVDPNV